MKSVLPGEVAVKIVESDSELQQAFAIRKQVFVEEQSVAPEIELDVYDKTATHILAMSDGEAVGTARWRETERGTKLERFAVLRSMRRKGIGKALVQFTLEQLEDAKQIYLHAQSAVIPFYEKHGFKCIGNTFYEAAIPHRLMVYSAEKTGAERR